MKSIRILCFVTLLAQLPRTVYAQQYRMPQDNWYFSGLSVAGNFGAIAIGPDDNIYVATNNSAVAVFKTDGTFLRQFGSDMNIAGIALDSQTNVYLLDLAASTNLVKKFNTTGGFLMSFAARGTNETEILPSGEYSRIAVGKNDQVYVADNGNYRVQVFTTNGSHLFHWGESSGGNSGFASRFSELNSIALMPNGNIVARNSYQTPGRTASYRSYELQMFSPEGQFLTLKTPTAVVFNNNLLSRSIATSPDGLVWSWPRLHSQEWAKSADIPGLNGY